ncbi:unnamed protein product [Dicrocoelium dendriticum]|nr:unnamed protein product [Dicrocoelium dendriticum]
MVYRGTWVALLVIALSQTFTATQAVNCYHDTYNQATGAVTQSTAMNCVFCIFEESYVTMATRKPHRLCSTRCWPYETTTSRRVCCQTDLCNPDYNTAKAAEVAGDP